VFHPWVRYVGRRVALPAVAALALILVGLGMTAPGAQAAPQAPAADAVQVRITSFTPVAPKPGDPVTITGTATNSGSTTLTNVQAIACLDSQRGRIDSTGELSAIPPAGDDCNGLIESTAFQDFADVLQPGSSRPFTVTVTWPQWEIDDTNGVYVVGVRINADSPTGERVSPGVARTLMPVMAAEPTPRQVRTAMVLPLRHRPTQLNGTYFADESLVSAMAPGGRLHRLVQAGTGKQLTWLIDPSLLDEARQLAQGYRTDGRDGVPLQQSQVAKDWLAALDRAVDPATGRSHVMLLPYGDPDVRRLVDGGLGHVVDRSRELTTGATGPGGKPVQASMWLENGAATEDTLAAAAEHEGSTPDELTLLSSWSWDPEDRPDLEASPLVRVDTANGPLRAVVADQGLTSGGPDPAAANGPVQFRQRFAAETALLALDQTGTHPVTVAAVPSRGFDVHGSATGVLMQAQSLPWITPIGLDQITAEPITTVPAPPTRPAATVLNAAQLEAVRQIDRDIRTYNALTTNTAAAKDRLDKSLVRSASLSWRGYPAEGDRFRAYQRFMFAGQFGKVHLITDDGGGDTVVTLSSSKGQFPLTVANELKRPVRVGLQIESLNRDDLSVEPIEPVVIRGGNRQTFNIRASAQQNGLIKARAHIVTATGERLGAPLELDIRAAQYGTVGWVLVGAAVALLFGTSAIRIYRRIRTERKNGSPIPERAVEHAPEPTTEPAPETAAAAPVPAEPAVAKGSDG